MNSLRLCILILLLANATHGHTQGFLRTYDLPDINGPSGNIITSTPTPDGGYLFYGVATFKRWLAKTDPLGEIQWMKEVPLSGTDVQADLYVTPDGHYALANYVDNNFATNSFLLLNAQGNVITQTDFTGFTRVVMTADGFLAANRVDIHTYKLFRIDWQGNTVWEKTKTTNYLGLMYDMTATQDGGLCLMVAYDSLANSFPRLIKAKGNGDVEWERSYAFQDLDFYGRIIQNQQGQFVCTNQFLTVIGSMLFAADANGDSLWSTPLEVYSYGLCETTDGGYGITGETPLSPGLELTKRDAGGGAVFNKSFNIKL